VSAEMPHLLQLKHDYEAWRSPADQAFDFIDDDQTSAGEKALGVAAPVARTAARGVELATRPLAALDAQFWSRMNRPGIGNKLAATNPLDPQALGAAWHALRGERDESAENPIAAEVRREIIAPGTVGAAHPTVSALTAGVVEALTNPSTLLAGGEVLQGGKLLRGLPLVSRVEEALTASRDARVAEFFARGGRVLDVEG